MSKKIAEGISGLVLDIKVGSGTFMKSIDQAKELGSWMKKIGNLFDIKTDSIAPLTDFSKGKQRLAKFSPKRNKIAFVRNNNIFIKDDR